jgi:hypothetical protein
MLITLGQEQLAKGKEKKLNLITTYLMFVKALREKGLSVERSLKI